MGFPVLDPIASVVICIFIGKAALDIFKDATDKMVDKSCDAAALVYQYIHSFTKIETMAAINAILFGTSITLSVPPVIFMVDKSCDEETVKEMRSLMMGETGVKGIDVLRTRMFGAKIYVDVEISVDENILKR